MKAQNEQELLTGLKIMRSHLDILIENLENKTFIKEENRNQQYFHYLTRTGIAIL